MRLQGRTVALKWTSKTPRLFSALTPSPKRNFWSLPDTIHR